MSLSQAAVTAAFSAGGGLLPARPPTYTQTPLAMVAPCAPWMFYPSVPAATQSRRGETHLITNSESQYYASSPSAWRRRSFRRSWPPGALGSISSTFCQAV